MSHPVCTVRHSPTPATLHGDRSCSPAGRPAVSDHTSDLWTWDGGRWSPIEQPAERPAPRGGGSLLSAGPARLLYFGGYNERLLGDFWSSSEGRGAN